MNDKKYYNLFDDIDTHPGCWCIIAYSRRGVGKTYGALAGCIDRGLKPIYIKRTMEDVDLICAGDGMGVDLSPYSPINRDRGTNIQAVKIKKGLGAFYEGDAKTPTAYIIALSAVRKFKGFDMSDCDIILFDEFIPQVGEIVKRSEGDSLLELYMTVSRDRERRGKEPLKLVLMANATQISTPVTNALGVVDVIADMESNHIYQHEHNGIFIHAIKEECYQMSDSEFSGIRATLANTQWGRMAFGGEFGYNDFSCVGKISLKGYKPYAEIKTRHGYIYIYYNDNSGIFYACHSRCDAPIRYDLTREVEQKAFWLDLGIELYMRALDNKFLFEKYSYYDLIINYKKLYSL